MRGMPLVFSAKWAIALGLIGGVASCAVQSLDVSPRIITIQQPWQLQPGSMLAGHQISGGLGDISIELRGSSIYAPFQGKVQPGQEGCVLFSSPEIPSYLLRLCGLRRPRLGDLRAGDAIGSGQVLQCAALRKQPNGEWAMVEPSSSLLEQILKQQ
jgi:hypothetical protein